MADQERIRPAGEGNAVAAQYVFGQGPLRVALDIAIGVLVLVEVESALLHENR